MKKCDCYHIEEEIIGWHTPVDPQIKTISRCWGTKEREECSCGGDRTRCNFYPEVSEKALKEQPKFGEWISVEDRLPEDFKTVLALCKDGRMFVGRHTSWHRWEIWTAMKSTKIVSRTVTHWMPLPSPPTEKES